MVWGDGLRFSRLDIHGDGYTVLERVKIGVASDILTE